MICRTIILLFFSLIIIACEPIKRSKKVNIDFSNKYKNAGFSLIYKEELDIKKLDNRSLTIFHKTLKKIFNNREKWAKHDLQAWLKLDYVQSFF